MGQKWTCANCKHKGKIVETDDGAFVICLFHKIWIWADAYCVMYGEEAE